MPLLNAKPSNFILRVSWQNKEKHEKRIIREITTCKSFIRFKIFNNIKLLSRYNCFKSSKLQSFNQISLKQIGIELKDLPESSNINSLKDFKTMSGFYVLCNKKVFSTINTNNIKSY